MPAPTIAPRRIYHPIQKDHATLLESAAESGGERTLLEVEVAPGGGNALHRHLTYAERFEVIEGTLAVRVGEATTRLGAGEAATAPVGAPHCFRNEASERVIFQVELRPGHAGFERALQAGYGLAADGRTRADGAPRNLLELATLVTWGDFGLTGPQRLLSPAFGLLARLARRRGVDRRLAERYCTW